MLFAIVWTTDVCGYFAGRAFGGPKLMPRVSPKKTWSGAIGGTVGAMIVAICSSQVFSGRSIRSAIAGDRASCCRSWRKLAICSNPWIKRQFGAKDASQLIPGHGGVMDRLDGFWAAAVAGCLIGLLRGGFDGACARPAGMVSV